MRRFWLEGKPIPHVPFDENPDLNSCHLYQQLQVINCCIARKRRRESAIESLDSFISQSNSIKSISSNSNHEPLSSPIFARNKTGDLVLRVGADHQSENLTMLETNEPIYSPVTQVYSMLFSLNLCNLYFQMIFCIILNIGGAYFNR